MLWHLQTRCVICRICFLCVAVPGVTIERHGEKSKTVVEGHDVELNCTVWGWPLPNVTWRHESNILDLTDLQNVTSVANVSLSLGLNMKNLNMSDRGNFVCEASNVVDGTVYVRSETILVRVKGQCDSVMYR